MTQQEQIAAAERALARRDRVMRRLIRQAGPCTLGTRRQRSHFDALVRAIVYQQLAGKAAAAIHGRFLALFDGGRLSPETVLALTEPQMRSAGLSGAKVASIRDLAAKSLDGTVPLRGFSRLSDDEIVERLSSVRGIGRWTAEMFLMFQLARPDVWPVDDLGCATATASPTSFPRRPRRSSCRSASPTARTEALPHGTAGRRCTCPAATC